MFYQSDQDSGSGLFQSMRYRFIPTANLDKEVNVEAKSLQSLMKQFDLPNLDLLWLDLQGQEINIISELIVSKEIFNINYILTDEIRKSVSSGAVTFSQINLLLRNVGF